VEVLAPFETVVLVIQDNDISTMSVRVTCHLEAMNGDVQCNTLESELTPSRAASAMLQGQDKVVGLPVCIR